MATALNNKKLKKCNTIFDGVSTRCKRINVNNAKVWSAESDLITLTATVKQAANSVEWQSVDYYIREDWEVMTITDSHWGKSYGRFQTKILLVEEDGTINTLASRNGAYGGTPMAEEPVVDSGTVYTVKKGQIIRLSVGASYNPDVSGRHTTTSFITFILS